MKKILILAITATVLLAGCNADKGSDNGDDNANTNVDNNTDSETQYFYGEKLSFTYDISALDCSEDIVAKFTAEDEENIPASPGVYFDEAQEGKKTILYKGKDYECEYEQTINAYDGKRFMYESDDVEVVIDENDKVISIYFIDVLLGYEENKAEVCSSDEIEKKAIDYFDGIVDISEYNTEFECVSDAYNGYRFMFTKNSEGVALNDAVQIWITDKGDVVSYIEEGLNSFSKIQLEKLQKENIDDENLQNTIKEDIIEKLGEDDECACDVVEDKLYYAKDEIFRKIKYNIQDKSANGEQCSGIINVTVKVDGSTEEMMDRILVE